MILIKNIFSKIKTDLTENRFYLMYPGSLTLLTLLETGGGHFLIFLKDNLPSILVYWT